MDQQQIKNRVKEAVGAVKEEGGTACSSRNLLRKGAIEKGIGRIQAKYGDLESDIENDIEDNDDDCK